MGLPRWLSGKESTCNAGDPGSIPGSGRSTGEGIGYPLQYSWASLVAQLVKNLPVMWETWVGKIPCRRERLPIPVFRLGEFQELYSPWACQESDTAEQLSIQQYSIPGGLVVKNPSANAGDVDFYPWVGKILRRRRWQPGSVFLHGKSYGERSQSWTQLSDKTTITIILWYIFLSWFILVYPMWFQFPLLAISSWIYMLLNWGLFFFCLQNSLYHFLFACLVRTCFLIFCLFILPSF